jgi:hypothetical protein
MRDAITPQHSHEHSAGPGPCVPERRTTHHRPGLQGAFLHRAELVPLERYRTAGGVHYTTQAAAKRESRQPTGVSVPSRPHAHPKPTQTERRAQALTGMVDGDADGGRVIAIESQHRCLPWLPARGTATSDSQSLIAPYRYNAVRLFRFEAEAIRRRFSLTVCSLSDVQTSCEDPPPPNLLTAAKNNTESTHSSSTF